MNLFYYSIRHSKVKSLVLASTLAFQSKLIPPLHIPHTILTQSQHASAIFELEYHTYILRGGQPCIRPKFSAPSLAAFSYP